MCVIEYCIVWFTHSLAYFVVFLYWFIYFRFYSLLSLKGIICFGFCFFVILSIEGCLEWCMLWCVMCVLYCIVLRCPVLYCSTLPPGMNPFAVNNNNNNNNNNNMGWLYTTNGETSNIFTITVFCIQKYFSTQNVKTFAPQCVVVLKLHDTLQCK